MKILSRHESISDVMNKLQRHHFIYLLIQGELDWPWDMSLSDILKPTQPYAESYLYQECFRSTNTIFGLKGVSRQVLGDAYLELADNKRGAKRGVYLLH